MEDVKTMKSRWFTPDAATGEQGDKERQAMLTLGLTCEDDLATCRRM